MRRLGKPPAYRQSPADAAGQGADSPWKTQRTPPATEFINLQERTSAELGQEPTFSTTAEELPADSSGAKAPHLTLILERTLPAQALDATITAATMDRRGLICAFADHSLQTYFLELRADSDFICLPQPELTTALEFDRSRGVFLSVDLHGELASISPFTRQVQNLARLSELPLALQLIPDTQRLYFGTERGALFRHDLRTGVSRQIAHLTHALSALELDRSSATALVGLWDGSIARLNLNGALQWQWPIAPDTIAHIGTLDRDRYFALDHQGTLYIGELQQGELLSKTMLGPGLRTLRRLNDGRLLGLSLFQDLLQIWQLIIES